MTININFSATLTDKQIEGLQTLWDNFCLPHTRYAYGLHGTVAKNLEKLGLVNVEHGFSRLTHLGAVVVSEIRNGLEG